MKTLILNNDEVKELLTIRESFIAVGEAYKAYSSGKIFQPPIVSIEVPNHNGEMDIKSGYTMNDEIIGVKMASGYWDNPKDYDLPSGLAAICLFDAKNGYPICILDGSLITYYRTAAAGALAATLLARKNSDTVGILGTGGLARMQFIATNEFFNLKKAKIWGIETDQKKAYIKEFREIYKNVEFIDCDTAEQAIRDSDIVITATPSHNAIVMNEWIEDGTHINAFGCDMEGKQELDPNIFKRAKVVVDNIQECIKRGETQHSVRTGLISKDDIHAEIGEIVLEKKAGRTTDQEITIFDSTGMSIQDITTSLMVYRKALEKGVGKEINFI